MSERSQRKYVIRKSVELSAKELEILVKCMIVTCEAIGSDFDFESRVGMEVEDVVALRIRLEGELRDMRRDAPEWGER